MFVAYESVVKAKMYVSFNKMLVSFNMQGRCAAIAGYAAVIRLKLKMLPLIG